MSFCKYMAYMLVMYVSLITKLYNCSPTVLETFGLNQTHLVEDSSVNVVFPSTNCGMFQCG